jgi:hypothetical protein
LKGKLEFVYNYVSQKNGKTTVNKSKAFIEKQN